jgi:hypothetical protein
MECQWNEKSDRSKKGILVRSSISQNRAFSRGLLRK